MLYLHVHRTLPYGLEIGCSYSFVMKLYLDHDGDDPVLYGNSIFIRIMIPIANEVKG